MFSSARNSKQLMSFSLSEEHPALSWGHTGDIAAVLSQTTTHSEKKVDVNTVTWFHSGNLGEHVS